MGLLKNFFLSIFFALAVFSASMAIGLNALYSTAFNETFWLKSFDDANIYSFASGAAEKAISDQTANAGLGLKIGVSASMLKQQTQTVLPAFFKYLRGETQTVNAEISLAEQKAEFVDALVSQFKQTLGSIQLPDCKPEEKVFSSSEAQLPNCFPTTMQQKTEFLDYLTKLNPSISVPDKISVSELMKKLPTETTQQLSQFREIIKLASLAIIGLAILFLLMLAIIFFLSRSLNWLGGTIAIAGILSALPVIIISNIPINSLLPEQGLGTIAPVVTSLFKSFLSAIQASILLYSIILIIIGIAIVAANFLLKKQKEEKKTQ